MWSKLDFFFQFEAQWVITADYVAQVVYTLWLNIHFENTTRTKIILITLSIYFVLIFLMYRVSLSGLYVKRYRGFLKGLETLNKAVSISSGSAFSEHIAGNAIVWGQTQHV